MWRRKLGSDSLIARIEREPEFLRLTVLRGGALLFAYDSRRIVLAINSFLCAER
jgi:hypothetical protein